MSFDDVEEFMSEAARDPFSSSGAEMTVPKGLIDSVKATEKVKSARASLSQYADLGGAFTPTNATIKTLPADCYTIGQTMEGAIIYSPQNIVTDNLLRLPDSRSDEVIKEVEKFWTLKDKFKEFGFAHKRGFLLFGPPGSGKSSTIAILIADMVKAGGTVFIAENPGTLGKALKQFRAIEPDRPLAVIWEDIDAVIQCYGESTVLAILDGEAQVENVVFIATTNYPEKLDGRIINRPSRFDKIVKIGMPNPSARELYIKSKLGHTEKDGINLVEATEGMSIAHIKELIVSVYCQENPVKETVERLKRMKITPKSDGDFGPIGFGR